MICTSNQSYLGDEIENIETARVCTTNGDRRDLQGEFWGKPDGKKLLGKTGLVGRIKLRCFLKKCNVRHGLDRTGSRQGQVESTYECGNECKGSKRRGKIVQFIKNKVTSQILSSMD